MVAASGARLSAGALAFLDGVLSVIQASSPEKLGWAERTLFRVELIKRRRNRFSLVSPRWLARIRLSKRGTHRESLFLSADLLPFHAVCTILYYSSASDSCSSQLRVNAIARSNDIRYFSHNASALAPSPPGDRNPPPP